MIKRHCQLAESHLRSMALIVALVCLATLGAAHAATAANKQEAAKIALQENGNTGKVLGVNTETDSEGQVFFAVKILSDGRIRVIRIAQSP